nr:hypothetical protein [Tanacetum cinerariifolium]
SGEAPIPPPTIPSIILENLPTFNSAFCFKERLRLLEKSFYEYRQTNQFADAVSAIPVSHILPRVEESVNATLEAEVLTRSSHSSRTSYAVAADLSEMELKKIIFEKMEGNKRREDDDQEGPSAGPNRGSKRQKEGGEQASASTPSEKATKEEPVQTTCQIEETPLSVYETGANDQPIVQTSQHLEWFSQPRKPPSPDHAWNT